MIRNWGKLLAALLISGYICVMYEFMAGLRLVGFGLVVFALAMWYLYTVRRQIEMDGVEELKLAAKNDPVELCCKVRNTGILPVPFACLIVERQGEKKPQKYADTGPQKYDTASCRISDDGTASRRRASRYPER